MEHYILELFDCSWLSWINCGLEHEGRYAAFKESLLKHFISPLRALAEQFRYTFLKGVVCKLYIALFGSKITNQRPDASTKKQTIFSY